MSRTIQIGDHLIGSGQPAYLIAELSANHNGSLERALEIVRLAAESGADAIKLQTYTADTMTMDEATRIATLPQAVRGYEHRKLERAATYGVELAEALS